MSIETGLFLEDHRQCVLHVTHKSGILYQKESLVYLLGKCQTTRYRLVNLNILDCTFVLFGCRDGSIWCCFQDNIIAAVNGFNKPGLLDHLFDLQYVSPVACEVL